MLFTVESLDNFRNSTQIKRCRVWRPFIIVCTKNNLFAYLCVSSKSGNKFYRNKGKITLCARIVFKRAKQSILIEAPVHLIGFASQIIIRVEI